MENRRTLINYLPDYLKEIKEIKAVLEAVQYDLDTNIYPETEALLSRAFFDTTDERGAEGWERIMKITPESGSTLSERRGVLKVTANNFPPYTDETLENKLKILCGDGNFLITRNYGSYTMNIKLALTVKSYREAVEKLMKRIIPCNINHTCELMYNQWSGVKDYTWGQINSLTWKQAKEDSLEDLTDE